MVYREACKVNFVNCNQPYLRILKAQIILRSLLVLLFSVYLQGCTDEILPVTPEQLSAFKNAGPGRPVVDVDRLVDAKIGGGPHRVVPGEVIEFTMPTVLQIVTAEEPDISGKMAPHICRVSQSGTITLPVIGSIEVEGKTLAEIEEAVIEAYHSEYTITRPSIFAQILEYQTAEVSITGAVNKPGIYSLRTDQMSLVALLMQAEGIVDDGAAFIRIVRSDQAERNSGSARTEGIDVQLSFRPTYASGTKGGLTMTSGRRTLLAEQLDISSDIERRILLAKLAKMEPRASVAVVDEKLRTLADMLGSSSGAMLAHNRRESRSMPGKFTGGSSRAPKSGGNQKLNAKAALAGLGYGPRENEYRHVSGNFGLYDKFSTDDTEPTLVSDAHLYEPGSTESPVIAERVAPAKSGEPVSLVLPIKGFNIPFADVALTDGDRVIVERLREPMFTVVGLVNRAGNFPYPPDVEYNLMHALGFAGGLNLPAEPRYATVYRLAADGTTVSTTFNVAGIAKSLDPTDALSVPLKPYDVVAVEHTPRTRAKVFWDRVFRFYISTVFTTEDIFGDD
jgi:protein involved in polysaccharide export with SLBB domain